MHERLFILRSGVFVVYEEVDPDRAQKLHSIEESSLSQLMGDDLAR
jgi:hypothetical protein